MIVVRGRLGTAACPCEISAVIRLWPWATMLRPAAQPQNQNQGHIKEYAEYIREYKCGKHTIVIVEEQ